jgi:hypothetical protein
MTALTDQAIDVVVSRGVPMANVQAFDAAPGELKQVSSKQTRSLPFEI